MVRKCPDPDHRQSQRTSSETVADFNAKEEKFIRSLHKHYITGNPTVPCETAMAENHLTMEEYNHNLIRLQLLKVIIIGDDADMNTRDLRPTGRQSIIISAKICELVSELDHKPPVNQWKQFCDWWLSRSGRFPLQLLRSFSPALFPFTTLSNRSRATNSSQSPQSNQAHPQRPHR